MTGQVTELRNVRTADNGNTDRAMRAPTIKLKSMPGKPLGIDMEPIDALRLLSTFGTAEPGFANLMLSGLINAACDGGAAHPPGSREVNDALAGNLGRQGFSIRSNVKPPLQRRNLVL